MVCSGAVIDAEMGLIIRDGLSRYGIEALFPTGIVNGKTVLPVNDCVLFWWFLTSLLGRITLELAIFKGLMFPLNRLLLLREAPI